MWLFEVVSFIFYWFLVNSVSNLVLSLSVSQFYSQSSSWDNSYTSLIWTPSPLFTIISISITLYVFLSFSSPYSFLFPFLISFLFFSFCFKILQSIFSVRKLIYTTLITISINLYSFLSFSSPYSFLFPFLISFLFFSFCFTILQSIFSVRKYIHTDK